MEFENKIIHGFNLPKSLVSYLEDTPKPRFSREILERMSGAELGMDIPCGYYCLQKETISLRNIQKSDIAHIYGVEEDASPKGTKLDANFCLCLGVNFDEEGLVLDYRGSNDEPSILLGAWGNQTNVWIKLGESFEAFMESMYLLINA